MRAQDLSSAHAGDERVRDLEARLAEALETLEAIRRGEIDALVVNDRQGEHHIYTLETADRPYRFLIEQMQEGAVTLTADGTILYCNRRAAVMLDAPQERVIGQPLASYVAPADVPRLAQLLAAARSGSARGELALRPHKEAIPVQFSASLLHDSETTLLCGVLSDLTEQKRQLRSAAEATERIRHEIEERERVQDALRQAQKMQAIGQLAGGVAHDFNNLLQTLSSSVQLARRRAAAGRTEDLERYLDAALESIARAGALTHRLLAFSRRQMLSAQPVDTRQLIFGISQLIGQTVGPSITVEVMLQEPCWPILCDPNQLENALLNLAINARDAMTPGGGVLRIETEHAVLTEADLLEWSNARPGEYVRITVADTGCGMAPEVLAHAFEPFFTTKPTGDGTGLGLSQVHGFVAQSNGAVRLESEVGRGTSVHIYLARHHAASHPAIDGSPRPCGDVALVGRVLLVDDEDGVREAVADALSDLGCSVERASDGQTCMDALHTALRNGGSIDLLIADVGLPRGLNGRQLADAARELIPGLPVLLMTGFSGDAFSPDERLPPGMEVLHKPFTLEILAERVQHLLRRGRGPDRPSPGRS